jgi:hypothetical protein
MQRARKTMPIYLIYAHPPPPNLNREKYKIKMEKCSLRYWGVKFGSAG